MLNKQHHLPHNPGNTEKQGVASKRSLPDQGEGSVEGEPGPMAFRFKIENEWEKHRQDKELFFMCRHRQINFFERMGWFNLQCYELENKKHRGTNPGQLP